MSWLLWSTHQFQYKDQLINLGTGILVVKHRVYEIVFSLYKDDPLMRSSYPYNGIYMKMITWHTLSIIELKNWWNRHFHESVSDGSVEIVIWLAYLAPTFGMDDDYNINSRQQLSDSPYDWNFSLVQWRCLVWHLRTFIFNLLVYVVNGGMMPIVLSF